MGHYAFVGQPGEFITGADGNNVPGRSLTQQEVDELAPDARDALTQHMANNANPVYVYHDGELTDHQNEMYHPPVTTAPDGNAVPDGVQPAPPVPPDAPAAPAEAAPVEPTPAPE